MVKRPCERDEVGSWVQDGDLSIASLLIFSWRDQRTQTSLVEGWRLHINTTTGRPTFNTSLEMFFGGPQGPSPWLVRMLFFLTLMSRHETDSLLGVSWDMSKKNTILMTNNLFSFPLPPTWIRQAQRLFHNRLSHVGEEVKRRG